MKLKNLFKMMIKMFITIRIIILIRIIKANLKNRKIKLLIQLIYRILEIVY
jgi:hypothetical protein